MVQAEQSKRSLLKTITWRITASLDTFIIAWIITGDWKMGVSIAGIEYFEVVEMCKGFWLDSC